MYIYRTYIVSLYVQGRVYNIEFFIGQAMDIGAPAILFLIDAWEGHLTPPEAASIADKVSKIAYFNKFK